MYSHKIVSTQSSVEKRQPPKIGRERWEQLTNPSGVGELKSCSVLLFCLTLVWGGEKLRKRKLSLFYQVNEAGYD